MQRDGDIILLLLQRRQGHVDAHYTEFSTHRITRGPCYLQVGTNNILQMKIYVALNLIYVALMRSYWSADVLFRRLQSRRMLLGLCILQVNTFSDPEK